LHTHGTLAGLWKRAPWWRAAIVAAAVVTVAAIAFRIEQKSDNSIGPDAESRVASTPVADANKPLSHASTTPPAAPHANETGPARVVSPEPLGAPAASSDEEEQTLAACHPHLISGPTTMPQIDVLGVTQPNLAHIKIHMWVNGAGLVTRETMTEATYGTPAEQQAELNYAKVLAFSLPNTKECRGREVEVIGDVFETRDPSGKWATYVRLYPKLYFNGAGVLQHRE
jgi:hypothetical protein